MLPGNSGSHSAVTHDYNHQKNSFMETQCKALALGEFTFKRNWDHFSGAYGPTLAAMGHTHIKYAHTCSIHTLQAQRATKVPPHSALLSLHLQYVSKAQRTLHCACLICFLIHLNFSLSLFLLSPISRRLVDIRVACSFSHWPLQHTVDGGFLSCGHELDTVTGFHFCLKECNSCGLPFKFSLFPPTSIIKQFS